MYLLKNRLIELKQYHKLYAVKFDMESEGISLEMAQQLRDIASKLNLKYVAKIGGCGSLKDIINCKTLKADIIVAPMIETSYSLEKFIKSCGEVYLNENLPCLNVNIETITGAENFDNITAKYIDKFSGVVFGRSDFSSSLNIKNADSDVIYNYTNDIKMKTLQLNKDFIVGGSLTANSIEFMKNLNPSYIETRNLVFKPNITQETIKKYIEFEILWLEHKKVKTILDIKRLETLKKRI